jgi:hypothetical protein
VGGTVSGGGSDDDGGAKLGRRQQRRETRPRTKKTTKMRRGKKLLGGDLLRLALLVSLLRVERSDLDLLSRLRPVVDGLAAPFVSNGDDVWTLARAGDDLTDWPQAESYLRSAGWHPKVRETPLDRFQARLMDDLNELGIYAEDRNTPVEIAAFVLTNEEPAMSSLPRRVNSGGGESDSGISDTDELHGLSSSDSDDDSDSPMATIKEEEENDGQLTPENMNDDDEEEEGNVTLTVEVDGLPEPVQGSPAVSSPPSVTASTDFMLDPEDLENELVHIDDQLITIEDSLEVKFPIIFTLICFLT